MIKKFQGIAKALIVAAFMICITNHSEAQLVVNHAYTPTQLVSQILLGSGITVSNITYTGDTGAIGYFIGSSSNIGLPAGLMMCTGNIYNAVGPVGTNVGGTCLSLPGDSDLTNLCGCGVTNDACILEFDFVPTGDTVKFNYVFGSEEYPEFVGSFNDLFAFFISGPGIIGAPNIALIPNTTTAVSIDSVNNGVGYCPGTNPTGPCQDCQYYIDNCNGLTVNYGGFTTPFTAQHWVIPCQTYHIKIAIADAVDCVYDSGVFLEQGSFSGGTVSVSSHIHNTGSTNDTMLVEGCTTGSILFSLGQPQNTPYTVHFTIGGTAVNGVDYPLIPDSLIIPAGQTVDSFVIAPYLHNTPGPNLTVTIIISTSTVCSNSVDTITLWIRNVCPIQLSISNDTTICPNQTVPLTVLATNGYGTYTYLWNNGGGVDSVAMVSPANTTTYTVTVTDLCGNSAVDSVTVIVTSPESIAVTNATITRGCGTSIVTFSLNTAQATPTLITYSIGGTALNGVDYAMLPGNITIPAGQTSVSININAFYNGQTSPPQTIILTLTNTCLPSFITINILNEPAIIPNITGFDICQGQSTTLVATATGGTGPLKYSWSNGLGDSTMVTTSPYITTIYYVSVTDTCHAQVGTDSIIITVYPLPRAYFGFNYLEQTNVNFINLSTNAVSYSWQFGDGGFSTTDQHSFDHLYPDSSGSYYITLTAYNQEGCPDTTTAQLSFTDRYNIFVPTSFHPGFDLNPTFGAYSVGISSYQMDIFDRWGEHLFSTSDLANQWTGTNSDGSLLKQDVYVWIMKAIMKTGEKVERTGTVFLIR
jgi:hypothetical protein